MTIIPSCSHFIFHLMCTYTYTNYFYILQCFDPLSINFSPPYRAVYCIYTVLFHNKHRLLALLVNPAACAGAQPNFFVWFTTICTVCISEFFLLFYISVCISIHSLIMHALMTLCVVYFVCALALILYINWWLFVIGCISGALFHHQQYALLLSLFHSILNLYMTPIQLSYTWSYYVCFKLL